MGLWLAVDAFPKLARRARRHLHSASVLWRLLAVVAIVFFVGPPSMPSWESADKRVIPASIADRLCNSVMLVNIAYVMVVLVMLTLNAVFSASNNLVRAFLE